MVQALPPWPQRASEAPFWQLPAESQQPKGQSEGLHFLAAPQDSVVLAEKPSSKPNNIHLAVVMRAYNHVGCRITTHGESICLREFILHSA